MAAIALFSVAPVRGLGFVHDDRTLLENSSKVGDWSTLPQALRSDLFWLSDSVRPSPYWRPWISASYYLDHGVGGGSPQAFHVHNAILGVLLAFLVWSVAGRGRRGALASALLLLHPAFVEPLANITARTDLYVALLGLLAVFGPRRARLPAFGLALLCKETAVVIPALWVVQHLQQGRGLAEALRRCLPGFGVLVGWLALRGSLVGGRAAGPPWEGWGGLPGRLGVALLRMVAPGPGPRPDVDLSQLPDLPAAVGVGVAAALSAGLAVWAVRRRSTPALVLLTALMPLLVTTGLAGPGIRMADGLLAWPLAAMVLLVGFLPDRVAVLWLPLVAFLAVGHGARVAVWSSPETLWSAALQATPHDPRVQLKAGRVVLPHNARTALRLSSEVQQHPDPRLRREGHELAARALLAVDRNPDEDRLLLLHLRQAADPLDPEAGWACQARCVWDDGPTPAAVPRRRAVCEAAIAHGSATGDVWNALGILLAEAEDWPAVVHAFEQAVALDPTRREFHDNLQRARTMAASSL